MFEQNNLKPNGVIVWQWSTLTRDRERKRFANPPVKL